MKIITCLVVLAAMACSVPAARAQVLYGSLVVEAHDESGGVLPGADVTITQTETGWSRNAPTNAAGTTPKCATFSPWPPPRLNSAPKTRKFRAIRPQVMTGRCGSLNGLSS